MLHLCFNNEFFSGLHQRFRFSFLDGCLTRVTLGKADMGLTVDEHNSAVQGSPLSLQYYIDAGLKPAAALCWRTEVPLIQEYSSARTDPLTQTQTHGGQFWAMCTWRAEVMINWCVNLNSLHKSLTKADQKIAEVYGGSPHPIVWTLPDGDIFSTGGNRLYAGYKYLHWLRYNAADDQPQLQQDSNGDWFDPDADE